MKKKIYLTIILMCLVNYLCFSNSIPNDDGMKARKGSSEIPVFNSSYFPSNYHSRSFQWSLYSLKCPLAWEITKGSPNIYIGAKEILSTELEHPDMKENFTLISNNWGNNTQNIKKQNAGDSPPNYATSSLKNNHGISTLSCAIAGENNGNNAPMVGVAPKCRGFYSNSSIVYDSLDVDGVVNGKITVADATFQATGSRHDYYTLFSNGIVSTIGVGNTFTYSSGTLSIYIPHLNTTQQYWYPRQHFGTDGDGFYDKLNYPNNIKKYLRPITVGGMQDGMLYDKWCNPWATVNPWEGPNVRGGEDFGVNILPPSPNVWIFSFGMNKFANTIYDRNQAYIDVVVPTVALLNAKEGATTNNNLYHIGGAGTSQGSAMAAGVVGLMRSVSKYLLAETETNSSSSNYRMPKRKQDVHRNAYDIITFTADKLIDKELMPEEINGKPVATKFAVKDLSDRWVFGSNYNYNYITQLNDDLKRSWAIRMGFGKVNAYRAVAHSIRNKGEYQYTLSAGENSMSNMFEYYDATGDTRGYQNPDGYRLLHFGSKVKEGTGLFEIPISRGPSTADNGILNVLEWGGASLPGEYHNNQGVTRINSTNSSIQGALVVPNNCILAIDGIIASDHPNACNYVIAKASNSKILVEGYIHNVEVCGNIRVGDVIVNSTINNGVAGIPGCLSVSCGSGIIGNGDFYGKIKAINHGWVYSWGNIIFHPGAGLYLNGNTNFKLNGTSQTTFKSATEVVGNKITVHYTSKVIIDANSTVKFDCELNLNDNSELILEPGAVLHLKKLNAASTSKITMKGNSTIFLDCGNHTAGKIIITNASSTNKARFRSKLVDNCYPHESTEYLNSNSSCWAYLSYKNLGSNLSNYDTRNVSFSIYKTTSEGEIEFINNGLEIHSIAPNPVNEETDVTFSIPEQGNIKLSILDVYGNETMISETLKSQGQYTERVDMSNFSTGVYLLKISTNLETKVVKLIKD